ncbi:MAG: hypothetical protein AAB416_01825 [Patescibacteria group bacterium]
MKRFVILVFIFYIGFFSFLSSVDAKNYSSGDDAFEWHNLKKGDVVDGFEVIDVGPYPSTEPPLSQANAQIKLLGSKVVTGTYQYLANTEIGGPHFAFITKDGPTWMSPFSFRNEDWFKLFDISQTKDSSGTATVEIKNFFLVNCACEAENTAQLMKRIDKKVNYTGSSSDFSGIQLPTGRFVRDNGTLIYFDESGEPYFQTYQAKKISYEQMRSIPVSDAELTLFGKDSDGDGLSDIVEDDFYTSPEKKDTDGDGFDDKTEIIHGYNPLLPDEKLPIEEDRGSFISHPGYKYLGNIVTQEKRKGDTSKPLYWYVNPNDGGKRYLLPGNTSRANAAIDTIETAGLLPEEFNFLHRLKDEYEQLQLSGKKIHTLKKGDMVTGLKVTKITRNVDGRVTEIQLSGKKELEAYYFDSESSPQDAGLMCLIGSKELYAGLPLLKKNVIYTESHLPYLCGNFVQSSRGEEFGFATVSVELAPYTISYRAHTWRHDAEIPPVDREGRMIRVKKKKNVDECKIPPLIYAREMGGFEKYFPKSDTYHHDLDDLAELFTASDCGTKRLQEIEKIGYTRDFIEKEHLGFKGAPSNKLQNILKKLQFSCSKKNTSASKCTEWTRTLTRKSPSLLPLKSFHKNIRWYSNEGGG